MLSKFPKIADKIIEWGIIFLLVSTPLALPTRYGTVHLWVYTTIELTIFLLIMIWALKQVVKILGLCSAEHTSSGYNSKLARQERSGRPTINNQQSTIDNPQFDYNRFGFVKTPLNLPIILFVGLVIFQLMPLPSGALKLLSPNTYDLYRMSLSGKPVHMNSELRTPNAEIDNQQSSINNPSSTILNPKSSIVNRQSSNPDQQSTINNQQLTIQTWLPLSICHYATKSELILILAYIGMFFLVTNTPGIRLDRIMLIVMSIGFFISFLGILQKFTGTSKIYWLIDSPNTSLFGSFINRNHFAGYIGMVIPLSFGFLITRFGNITFSKTMTWRSILAKFESHFLGNILLVFAIMIMVSAMFLSLSRGGILSFTVSIIVFVTIVGLNRKVRGIIGKGQKAAIATLFLAFVFLMWLGIGSILERLSDLSSPGRHEVAQNTINMARDFPLFGTGLGTFQHIFPKYKTLEVQLIYDHAHNDYVELLSDSGLIGFLIAAYGIIIFAWKILVRWWERRDPYIKGVAMGGFCGVIAILCHSIVDFNMHIPANALFFSFILGLTWNAVNLKSMQIEE